MTLENLEIRNDLLVMNAIPLVITDSKIGKIKISVCLFLVEFRLK